MGKRIRLRYKIIFLFFIIFALCITFMWRFFSPVRVESVITTYLEKQLPNCHVEIDKINLNLLSFIEIGGIAIIDKDSLPLAHAEGIKISYSPISLLRGDIEKIILKSPKIFLRQTKGENWNISKIEYGGTGKKGILIIPRKVVIEGFQLEGDVKLDGSLNGLIELERLGRTKSINVKGRLELKDIRTSWRFLELTSINGTVPFAFEFKTVEEKPGIANVKLGDGMINIGTLKLGKFSIHNLWAKMISTDSGLGIEHISFDVYNGNGSGSADLRISAEGFEYNSLFEVNKIELSSLTNSYYPDRLFITGQARGTVKIDGKKGRLYNLEGDWTSIEPGGKIEVRSTKELLSLVPDSSQKDSLKLAFESMKDYTYNSGQMKLRSKGGDTVFIFSFSGPGGRRDIEIGLH